MKNITAWLETADALSVTIDFTPYSVPSDVPEYQAILKAVENGDAEKALTLIDRATAIQFYSGGKVVVRDGNVFYDNEPMHNALVNKILELMNAARKFQHLLNFLEQLMENPSKRAVDELYTFLEHRNLPITTDGCFLAYKAVRADYTDKHTGKFDNTPGKTLEMPRNKVDDDKDRGCSYGFHVGSLQYAHSFGCGSDKMIIAKVNPADVVSVPLDCNCQKLRTCRYEVLSDYKAPLEEPVYNRRGESFEDEETTDGQVVQFVCETLDEHGSVSLLYVRGQFEYSALTYDQIVGILEDNEGFVLDKSADHKGDWIVKNAEVTSRSVEPYEDEVILYVTSQLTNADYLTVRNVWRGIGKPNDLDYQTIINILVEDGYTVNVDDYNSGDSKISYC